MRVVRWLWIACGTCACSRAESGPGSVEILSTPAPFALQFVGLYVSDDAPAGALVALDLRRDGSYEAWRQGAHGSERGAYAATRPHRLPLIFAAASGALWTATKVAYDDRLTVTGEGATSSLRAITSVGPVEALCDATQGTWLDDDADPATGLYCRCSAPEVYLPSAGGCVR